MDDIELRPSQLKDVDAWEARVALEIMDRQASLPPWDRIDGKKIMDIARSHVRAKIKEEVAAEQERQRRKAAANPSVLGRPRVRLSKPVLGQVTVMRKRGVPVAHIAEYLKIPRSTLRRLLTDIGLGREFVPEDRVVGARNPDGSINQAFLDELWEGWEEDVEDEDAS